MKFSVSREVLLKPLQHIAAVVEKKQTKPILSNVLIVADGNGLALTGTDSELELVAFIPLDSIEEPGQATVPARKLMDIFRSLLPESVVRFQLNEQKMVVTSGRSRFSLGVLPAEDFPNLEEDQEATKVHVAQRALKKLFDKTAFAMAQQDVRFYLNGLFLELSGRQLRAVATDGHRLAICDYGLEGQNFQHRGIIVPRKSIVELSRLLEDIDDVVTLSFGTNHLRVIYEGFVFTTKLVSAKYPDYDRVVPKTGGNSFVGNCEQFAQALSRVAILSNEKFRGVRVHLSQGSMKMRANNPEQEEAEEEVEIDYSGDLLELGYNVAYLLDVLNAIDDPYFRLTLSHNHASSIIQGVEQVDATYVVMPMRI